LAKYHQFLEPALTDPKTPEKRRAEGAPDRLEIYKLLVEMADRVSQRRQAANNFYLSVNTLLVGGSAFLGRTSLEGWNIILIAVAGAAISFLWIRSIKSYASLNDAKFGVINELENSLAVQPFHDEWRRLHPPKDEQSGEAKRKRHRPFHEVEVWIPWVFISLYGIQIIINVPWVRLGSLLRAC
jgi:hypothetical protein